MISINITASVPVITRDEHNVSLNFGGAKIVMSHSEAYALSDSLRRPPQPLERVENLRELNDKPSGVYRWGDFRVTHTVRNDFLAKWHQVIRSVSGDLHSERYFSAVTNTIHVRHFYPESGWQDWNQSGGKA